MRVSLVVVIALSVLAACTSRQKQVELPPLPAVEAHVISGEQVVRRTIASTTDESILGAEFQQILASDDVEGATKAYVDRYTRLFFRTQGLMNDFDAKLDAISKEAQPSQSALMTDDTYARMLAAWTMHDEAIGKLQFFYNNALVTESQNGDDSKMAQTNRANAALITKAFRDSLVSSPNSINRLAKQDLIVDLMEQNQMYIAYQSQHGENVADLVQRVSDFNKVLKGQLLATGDDLTAFYKANGAQLARETTKALGDQEINGELERLAPDAKKHLQDQFEDRAPQALGAVAVGLGRKGMMNGCEFAPGYWALTYDDGPHPTYTLQDLANLDANGMKATFFWVAHNVVRYQSIIDKVRDDGHTLANHSYTHAQLTKLGPSGLVHEIDDALAVDIKAYGFHPKFYRCPYGACGSQTSTVRQKIADDGMISVTWNVDSLDWQDHNPQTVYERAKKQMAVQKHGIILFHDIHPQSVIASQMIQKDFAAGRASGQYHTVTIQEAFDKLNSPQGM